MNHRHTIALFSLLGFIILPSIAAAHPISDITDGGYLAGMLHPFAGIDHLLAMVAIGLWAATLGGSAVWRVPGAFVTMLIAGAVIGMSGVHLVEVEPVIALSVLLLGLAITFTLRVSTSVGVFVAGMFSFFHGYSHGLELSEMTSGYMYLVGIGLSSIALHIIGIGLGITLKRSIWLLRSSGVVIAGAGMWLVAGL